MLLLSKLKKLCTQNIEVEHEAKVILGKGISVNEKAESGMRINRPVKINCPVTMVRGKDMIPIRL